jgi:hypothetical protein
VSSPPDPAEPDLPDATDLADLVAEVVLACPVVAALAADGFVATFLPGRRVAGVRIAEDVCEVAVVLRMDGSPLPELAEQVRRAVAPVVGDRRVDVVIADVVIASDVSSRARIGSGAGVDAEPLVDKMGGR